MRSIRTCLDRAVKLSMMDVARSIGMRLSPMACMVLRWAVTDRMMLERIQAIKRPRRYRGLYPRETVAVSLGPIEHEEFLNLKERYPHLSLGPILEESWGPFCDAHPYILYRQTEALRRLDEEKLIWRGKQRTRSARTTPIS